MNNLRPVHFADSGKALARAWRVRRRLFDSADNVIEHLLGMRGCWKLDCINWKYFFHFSSKNYCFTFQYTMWKHSFFSSSRHSFEKNSLLGNLRKLIRRPAQSTRASRCPMRLIWDIGLLLRDAFSDTCNWKEYCIPGICYHLDMVLFSSLSPFLSISFSHLYIIVFPHAMSFRLTVFQ